MKIKFRLVSYKKFLKKIAPVSVLWHRQEWADHVISRYYGRYSESTDKKDVYYLQIEKTIYTLHSVEDLINLDHDLYLNRLKNAVAPTGSMKEGFNFCSICAHRKDCPFLSFNYQVRKKACLFIPVFHTVPSNLMEMQNLRPARSRLITEVLMNSIYHDRNLAGKGFEACTPLTVYKHTFTFSQLQ